MTKFNLTVHTIIRNEEKFIWYALNSVIDYVDKILVYDTGSTDNTIAIIKSIDSPKIEFHQKGQVNRRSLVSLRQEQIDHTQTTWFYLVDGDEIYPLKTIKAVITAIKTATPNQVGLYLPFYNLVGDIYHTQHQRYGRYHIGNKTGHINLRGIRKTPGLKVVGSYPLEAYQDKHQTKIQDYPSQQLIYLNQPFFHAGNLTRSSLDRGVLERKMVYDLGLSINPQSLPQIFFISHPPLVPDVTHKRSLIYFIISLFFTLARGLKYLLESLNEKTKNRPS